MLAYARNQAANLFASMTSVILFGANAPRTLYSFFSRLALSTAYSTTLDRMKTLADGSKRTITGLGRQWAKRRVILHGVYDNINAQEKVWNPSLGQQNRMDSATAATLIEQEDVDPAAYDGRVYEERRRNIPLHEITVDKIIDDIDNNHLDEVVTGNFLQIIIHQFPFLEAKFGRDAQDYLNVKHRKNPAPLRPTKYHAMQTTGYNEATIVGNRSVVRDLVTRQLGITPHELEGRLFPFSGDQSTIASLRTLKHQTNLGGTWFSSHRWVLPIIELWHMGVAHLKGIFQNHWAADIVKGDGGLRFIASSLRRKINIENFDFYPGDRLAGAALTTMLLHHFR